MVRSTLQKRIASALLLTTIAVQLQVSGAFAALQNTPAFRPFIGVQSADAQSATRTFSSNDAIRAFVTSTPGGTFVDGQTSVRNDDATAQKVCQMAGYSTVSSKSCVDPQDGRCNYTSCGDNYHQVWNGNSWSRQNSCGATWLAQLTCSNPITTGGGAQCSNGIDDDGDGKIDALVNKTISTAGGNFAQEGADPKYDKTWIATITCRNPVAGQNVTFGNGDAQQMAQLVALYIRNEGLPFTQPAQAIVRSDGGGGGGFNWNDNAGTIHMPTVTAVCQILGDANWTYVSSTCRDNERSGIYPNGKCNFHSPGDNNMHRFVGTISVAACSDGIDNDGDGQRDYPSDSGCASANDASEIQHDPQCTDPTDNTESDAACSDGRDNDGDGLTDFPQDPGCVNAQDTDEFNAAACQDGIDNDGDGATDYPNDFSCYSPTDNDETNPKAACQDGADNDGDGLRDFPQDPGCINAQDNDEFNASQCNDGIDNDQDGATDYPNDFSCSSPTDNDETNPKAACQDGFDNDGDGLVDFPQDPGCASKQDNDEFNAPTMVDLSITKTTAQTTVVRGQTLTYTITVANAANAAQATNVVVTDTIPAGLSFNDNASYVPCTQVGNAVSCPIGTLSAGAAGSFQLVFDIPTIQNCTSSLNISNSATIAATQQDGNTANNTTVQNPSQTTVTCPVLSQCQDGIDNDQDGAADYPNDFSCSSPTDNDETNPKAACQDGFDNDGDGLVDFPQDPGCASKQDNDESNVSQCNDGIDNDQDGATDYPNDFSCSSPTDNDETNPKAACQDGFDNDFDGKVDFPQDPGCASKQDNDEYNAPLPACQDGIDNDGDGRIDLQDPGCSGPTDTNEGDEAACQDLRDNDGDGLIDFPFDPGCASPTDNDEFNQTQTVDVQITKTGPASVVRGQTLVYTIQVGNAGNAQATNVTVVDQVPAGVTFNDNASYFPCVQQGNQVSCPIGTLPAGVFGSFQIAFDVPTIPNCVQGQTPPIVNAATITATEDNATTGNNASSTANAPARVDCPAVPQCNDGIDNDQDGATDYPNDFSCSSPTDTDETNPKAACQDGFDNDFDGLVDFPQDPGCASKQDNDESNAPATQCTDGIDNDGDGRADTQDPGCANPTDTNEGDGPADLGVTLNGPSTVQGGSNATYVATIVNNGPDAVTTPASIRFTIPAGVTLNQNSTSSGCVQNGTTVTCSGITLGATFPNNQTQRTISFFVPGSQFGSLGTNLLDIALGVQTAHAQAAGLCNTTFVVTVTILPNANPDPNQANNNASVSTTVSCQQFQCSDGIDNDQDGRVDFPSDPGCSSAQDNNEGDEAACQDRRDNDGDGLVDWPLDPGCVSPTDTDEFNAPLPACSDGIDNDHDGRVDMLDPGCSNPQDTNEGDDPACSDRIDNDNDGLVDWPLDPGCVGPTDTDEANALPQCSDGIDNDFDGKVDMLDPGCSGPQDNNESDDPVQSGCVEITKQTFDPHGTALPVTAQFTFVLDATRVAYNDSTGRARFDNVLAGTHTVAEIIPSGWTQLSITPANGLVTVTPGQACAQITFRNRQVFVANAQCSDGYDNDGDGLVDYPQDTGCSSATDNDEYNSTFVPQCRDGVDNDGDGLSDFPNDPGCQNQDDNNEQNQSVTPACSDNLDNDGDGLKDYPADPGCANALDTDETNAAGSYACNDNVDNDGDGVKDFPADPGCSSATDNDEFNFRVARCSDGIDNDGDGLKDYPQDTGCTTPYDDNEYNDRLWLDRWREWWNWNW